MIKFKINKIMHKILIIGLLILLYGKAISQENLNFAFVDSTTYNYYIKKDWKNLIKLSNKAFSKNIDYYYLRMRTGIAYYNQKKFIKAIPHFIKALNFNNDTIAIEYLYYSYIFSGKYFDAKLFADKQEQNIKQKLLKNNKPNNIFFDYQYTNSNNSKIHYSLQDVFSQSVISDEKYYDFGINKMVKNNRLIYNLYFAHYSNTTNNYHYDQVNGYINNKTNISESELFGGFFYHINNKNNFSIYTNIIIGKSDANSFYRRQGISRYIIPNINFNYYYNFNIFKFRLGNNIFKLDSSLFYYPYIEASIMPLNNNKLEIFYRTEFINNIKTKSYLKKPIYVFGVKTLLFDKIALSSNYKIVNSKNLIEENGYIIYNNNIIKDKILVELSTYFNSHINFFIRYQYINFEDNYILNMHEYINNYKTQTFLGGIKWTY